MTENRKLSIKSGGSFVVIGEGAAIPGLDAAYQAGQYVMFDKVRARIYGLGRGPVLSNEVALDKAIEGRSKQ